MRMSETLLPHPNADGLLKINGRISGYRCVRARASFVFTQNDKTKIDVIAEARQARRSAVCSTAGLRPC